MKKKHTARRAKTLLKWANVLAVGVSSERVRTAQKQAKTCVYWG
jgi:hypothetical protein